MTSLQMLLSVTSCAVNALDNDFTTPLIMAAVQGNESVCELLVSSCLFDFVSLSPGYLCYDSIGNDSNLKLSLFVFQVNTSIFRYHVVLTSGCWTSTRWQLWCGHPLRGILRSQNCSLKQVRLGLQSNWLEKNTCTFWCEPFGIPLLVMYILRA